MGTAKTISRLQDNFFWPSIHTDIHQFIQTCSDCSHTKCTPQKPAGLLNPLSVPHRPWEDLALDLITGLPNYQGYTIVLVVVDRFSKGGHFGMLPSKFTAFKAATLFLELVCKLHGFPKSLVSDRDLVF